MFEVVQIKAGDRLTSAYRQLRASLWPDCDVDSESEIAQQLDQPDAWAIFLALANGHVPAGFVEVHLREYAEGAESSPVPFVEGWFVESSYRRQGVGRLLMQAAEQWAVSRGFREIASDSTLENTGSIAAHRELGYSEVERQVCFLKHIAPHKD